MNWSHDHKLRKYWSLKYDFEYGHRFNNLQIWTKCNLNIFLDFWFILENYCKSYTNLKFELKNIIRFMVMGPGDGWGLWTSCFLVCCFIFHLRIFCSNGDVIIAGEVLHSLGRDNCATSAVHWASVFAVSYIGLPHLRHLLGQARSNEELF